MVTLCDRVAASDLEVHGDFGTRDDHVSYYYYYYYCDMSPLLYNT